MKITICGSVTFAKKLVEIYHQLEKLGHEPVMHEEMFGIADGTAKEIIDGINLDHAEIKRKYGFIKIWHGLIKSSDAILVCNYDKNGMENYIGGNTLMEIGFAHVLNQKIFLYNSIPDIPYYKSEIEAMKPEIINGDLSKIK